LQYLKRGSTGPAVELLQLALTRAGFGPLCTDGIFGELTQAAVKSFQQSKGLIVDGVVGSQTLMALLPWYLGYLSYTVRRGDSIYSIAQRYDSSEEAILLANPGAQALNLQIGQELIVPLNFPVVPTTIAYSSRLVSYCIRGLSARYPFIGTGEIGYSVIGRPIWRLKLGSGENRVLYNAGFHANEWICVPVLLKFVEELAAAFATGGRIFSTSAAEILDYASLYIVPAVNPDGIDLVTGALSHGEFFNNARRIGETYPQFSFPEGWKANIQGVDLNLQFPAQWEKAKEIKFSQGIVSPSPADFVGSAPLTAPEARAMYDYTLSIDPALVLAYHTQGQVIYWKYDDFEPENSRDIAASFAAVSGYVAEETPYASGFAGYKDWFIESFNRPGYTIEAGLGVNPLPLSQFDEIYSRNLGILTLGALVT
jgi:g-D-glutamyl-meso-diaminopimelate peptidase